MRIWVQSVLIFGLGWLLSWWYYLPLDRLLNNVESVKLSSKSTLPAFETVRESVSVQEKDLSKFRQQNLSPQADLQSLLLDGQYFKYFEYYQELQLTGDSSQLEQLRQQIYTEVKRLQTTKQNTKVFSVLQQLLAIDYDNVIARQMLATTQFADGNYLAAIELLYSAKAYAQTSDTANQINIQLRRWVSDLTERYKKANNDLERIDLYRKLNEQEPDYAPYYLELAEAYLALGNRVDAKRAIDLASFDVEVNERVQQLQQKIDQKSEIALTDATAIPLRRFGEHYAIDVVINGSVNATLMLDTGATLTIISPELQAGLGARTSNKSAWFNTANGVVESVLLDTESLSAGLKVVRKTQVGVLNLSTNPHIDGLLGMDFLKYFKFYIDQEKSTLYLQ